MTQFHKLLTSKPTATELLELMYRIGTDDAILLASDDQLVKDIIHATRDIIAEGSKMAITKGGWEQLIEQSNISTKVNEIVANSGIVVFTKVLMQVTAALLIERQKAA